MKAEPECRMAKPAGSPKLEARNRAQLGTSSSAGDDDLPVANLQPSGFGRGLGSAGNGCPVNRQTGKRAPHRSVARIQDRLRLSRLGFLSRFGIRISALLLLGLLLLAFMARGADFSGWQFVQPFTLPNASLVKLDLPPTTLDAARADFADLRLTNPDGAEVPYLVIQTSAGTVATHRAEEFRVEQLRDATQITFATGLSQALGSVTLETPARSFIKGVTVEGSPDRASWEVIARNQQVFREAGGAGQLAIALPRQAWPFLRLRVDDSESPPVPFTGTEIRAAERDASPLAPVPIVITDRVENGTQTRLTLELGAAHLRLSALQLEASDPVYRRQVTLATCELEQDTITERVLARGVVSRLPGGAPADSQLRFDLLTPNRRLLLLIENGDAPPLQITALRAERRPAELLFFATQAGRYTIYSGNRACTAPHYDLPPQITAAVETRLPATVLPPLTANTTFRPPESLPEISGTGAPLDPKEWKFRKPVELSTPGVQQLALDLETLAHAQPGLGDLRLVRDGLQLPYVQERTTLRERVTPAVQPIPDPKQPTLSRWEIKLPVPAAPVVSLTCQSPAALFERDAVLYENATDERGGSYRHDLGRASWRHAPDQPARTLMLTLNSQPRTDTLLLEINNGDNPAIGLSSFELLYPVTRFLFKAPATDSVFLYYGNAQAASPQYDLRLVAGQLLAADKSPARLGVGQVLRGPSWADAMAGREGGWLLWLVLGGVVAALLAVIAKLMPKPPAGR
jgi:hypothetical protein